MLYCKPLTYYFCVKGKISASFHICISVPLTYYHQTKNFHLHCKPEERNTFCSHKKTSISIFNKDAGIQPANSLKGNSGTGAFPIILQNFLKGQPFCRTSPNGCFCWFLYRCYWWISSLVWLERKSKLF